MDNMKHRRLQELDRSDFHIVEGEPDIRGWDVKLANGEKIGEVEELIVDAKQRKVRYMVVDLDNNDFDLKGDKKVLVPIGLAELDHKEDDVLIPAAHPDQFTALPAYDQDQLDWQVERRICDVFGRNTTISNQPEGLEPDPEFYKHDYYNDDNLYKHRLHETELKKRQSDSEWERGLRLWEKRSEGGLMQNDDQDREEERRRRMKGNDTDKQIAEEARMEMVRHRRSGYEQRRYHDEDGRSHRTGGRSIEDRIRDEGLQDD